MAGLADFIKAQRQNSEAENRHVNEALHIVATLTDDDITLEVEKGEADRFRGICRTQRIIIPEIINKYATSFLHVLPESLKSLRDTPFIEIITSDRRSGHTK